MIELLVVADDRTGALETAGICADLAGGPVPVVVDGHVPPDDRVVVVIDAGTRHLDPDHAGRVVAGLGPSGVHRAHKIDSTLRGNWAHELVAAQRVLGGRVVIVPAFPALGRTCTDGVVSQHGVPVSEGHAGADARRPVQSSKPADHLRACGATQVVELSDAAALRSWIGAGEGGFAVCDASTDADLDSLAFASAWAANDDVLFAGTARSIGAAAAALHGPQPPAARPRLPRPTVVVCGSLHPMARTQLDALIGAQIDGVTVLSSPVPETVPVSEAAAGRAAADLLRRYRQVEAELAPAGLVIIGGDTAAAVLGEAAVEVGGTVAAGMPWMLTPDGRLVITRAGGFGHERSLLELFSDRMDA